MSTAGESLLLLGATRLYADWSKIVVLDSENSVNVLLEQMDALSIETELGMDIRSAVRIHGSYPIPAWSEWQILNLATGEKLQILGIPIFNPGSPRWKAYGQILTSVDQ